MKLTKKLLQKFCHDRDDKLSEIAVDQLLSERGRYINHKELIDIIYDNTVTDARLQYYFTNGKLPDDVTELHLKRCEKSNVEYCICLPDKQIATGEVI